MNIKIYPIRKKMRQKHLLMIYKIRLIMVDFLTIILLIFGVLQIILFFKVWGNDE